MQNHTTSNIHPFINPLDAAQPGAERAAAAAPDAERGTRGNPLAGGATRGRPSTYHPRIIEMLCQAIRQLGLSDSAAAEQMGLSTTTLSRWKQVHSEVGLQLQQARQEIRVLHLQKIMESAAAENGKGWRASAWILERLFPEDYAGRISDRFDALNLIEFRKDKERRQVQEEDEKARQERQRAEAAARVAQAAEAQAAAGPADAACIYSEGASHNSRNSSVSEVVPGVDNVGVSPAISGDSRRDAEAPDSDAASVASCVYSESDSRNSRNADGSQAATGPTRGGTSDSKEPGRPRPVDPNRAVAPPDGLMISARKNTRTKAWPHALETLSEGAPTPWIGQRGLVFRAFTLKALPIIPEMLPETRTRSRRWRLALEMSAVRRLFRATLGRTPKLRIRRALRWRRAFTLKAIPVIPEMRASLEWHLAR